MTTLLTIDDDPLVLKLLEKSLAREGFSILQSSSGEKALEILQERPVDLVICDISMPGMNGLQVLDQVSASHPALPVIMLTALDDIAMVVESMKLGAFDYLTKPFNHNALFLTIEKALHHKQRVERTLELEKENAEYRKRLEAMVFERTAEIQRKSESLEKLNRSLKKAHMDTVTALSDMLTIKDPYRTGHCAMTNEHCLTIGKKLKLSEPEMEHLSYAAYLHDIGELFIHSEVLNKQSRLSPDEYRQIREHPLKSLRVLEKISFFNPILSAVRSHHEWYDGTGYPDGLKGKQIPLLARIIHVADAYVAMTSARAHRPAMNSQQALHILEKNQGQQFDPEVVAAFVSVIRNTEQP